MAYYFSKSVLLCSQKSPMFVAMIMEFCHRLQNLFYVTKSKGRKVVKMNFTVWLKTHLKIDCILKPGMRIHETISSKL